MGYPVYAPENSNTYDVLGTALGLREQWCAKTGGFCLRREGVHKRKEAKSSRD